MFDNFNVNLGKNERVLLFHVNVKKIYSTYSYPEIRSIERTTLREVYRLQEFIATPVVTTEVQGCELLLRTGVPVPPKPKRARC